MSGESLAAAAEALAGTRFRLHGRDPETGLDCVGVLAAALAAIGRAAPLPNGYALRARKLDGLAAVARHCGFADADGPTMPGDVLLVRTAPCQFHLMIAVAKGRFIHAHAGLKRVVLLDRLPDWPICGRWRLNDQI
ncbi:MAG: hypothetical protein R3E09_01085 [Novosphingobium sp.]|nr:hypothetical protein [Novosphingobium sp.]